MHQSKEIFENVDFFLITILPHRKSNLFSPSWQESVARAHLEILTWRKGKLPVTEQLQEISWKDKMHMLRRDKKEEEDGDNLYLIYAFYIVANMLSQLYLGLFVKPKARAGSGYWKYCSRSNRPQVIWFFWGLIW